MKIGIILDSTKVSWYQNDLVEWIDKNPKLNLEVLLIQNIKSRKKSLFDDKFIIIHETRTIYFWI